MGVFCREAFAKGRLFEIGKTLGISDRSKLARASIRWILSQRVATVLVLSIAEPWHLVQNVESARQPALTDEDEAVLEIVQTSKEFSDFHQQQYDFFVKGFV